LSAPPLLSRVEVRLGLAFWIVVGTTATVCGAFWEWLLYATPVLGLVCLWPFARRLPRADFLLDWLPLPLVVFTYEMLHRIVPACGRGTIDAWLAAADRTLLGANAATWLEPLVSTPLTVAMAVFYAGYYPITVGLAIWLYVRSTRTAYREYVVGEIGALFIGYLGYLYLPAIGPHAWFEPSTWHAPLQGDFIGPAIKSLNARHAGAYPRDAFPSLHTANAVTALLVTWKHDRRRSFRVALVPCLGLIAATVYLRWHYLVDVVAGAALAVAWQAVVPRLVAREASGKLA
jgi:membrane-associated phospholipid phosphatase